MHILMISGIFLYFIHPILAVDTCAYTTCSCDKSTTRGYDINCPSSDTPNIKISLDLDTRLYGLNCKENTDYMSLLPKKYLPPDFEIKKLDLESIQFLSCSLPPNMTLQDVMDYLKINTTKKLLIMYSNLLNIKRKDLKGLEEIVSLTVIRNRLRDLPENLLYDLRNLIEFDMSSNNVEIPQNFFKKATQLKTLDLNNNYLPKNTTGMFDNLKKIMMLSMWEMEITNLDENIFRNISTVQIIELSLNKIESLPLNIFKQLTQLTDLSLRKNNLQQLPEGIFDNNVKLRKLKLDENKNLSSLPPNLFKSLTNLELLLMSSCNLTTIQENTFSGLSKLKEIDLSANKLITLPKTLFKDLQSLETLNLEYNHLEELPEFIFDSLHNLKELKLTRNKLKLSYNTFYGLNKLEILILGSNQLKHIDRSMFSSLANLHVLDVSNNELNDVPTQDLVGLKVLQLKNNNISFLKDDWRISKINLRELDLSYNQFTELTANELVFLSDNVVVDLRYNLIENINMDRAEELFRQDNPQPFPRGYKNTQVYLDKNPIHCSCNLYNLYRYYDYSINPEVRGNLELKSNNLLCASPPEVEGIRVNTINSKNFVCELHEENINATVCSKKGNCYLKPNNNTLYIDYSDTKITTPPSIDDNIIDLLHSKYEYLKSPSITLNLSRNNLENFTPQSGGYDHVTVLDLSYNKFKRIHWFPKSTEYLYLHGNNISVINSTDLEVFNSSKVKKITFYDNNWDCSCVAIDFLKYLQDNYKKVVSLYGIKCDGSDVELATLTVEQLCPINQGILIVSLVSVSILSLIITILSILFYRFNTEIKVWLYAHNYCLWWVTEEEIDKDKLYDAFISYSHIDEEFVASELLPQLENEPNPYKLCLHFRDWQPGEFIATNIAKSIAESRRTIVVLSPNFLQSEWGKMEFRTAHTQALSEGRARVIIILYGDVPTDDLDDELKAYLSTNTYLKWGDPWFWNKLRYALPHQPNFLKKNILHKIVTIYDDKSDLMQEPTTPSYASTPPADKIFFEPDLINNKTLNMYLANNTLIKNNLNLENNIIT